MKPPGTDLGPRVIATTPDRIQQAVVVFCVRHDEQVTADRRHEPSIRRWAAGVESEGSTGRGPC
jgi:hypothetical protein